MDYQKLRHWQYKLLHQSLSKSISDVYWKVSDKIDKIKAREFGVKNGTFVEDNDVKLYPLLDNRLKQTIDSFKDEYIELADLFCAHQFDLLGSGWCDVSFGLSPSGVEGFSYSSTFVPLEYRINQSNKEQALKIAAKLPSNYSPIDWQRDFKSGYRWEEKTWCSDVIYGHLPGVDVKVPWELSRMQHLPILAYAYRMTGKQCYVDEFRNELIDWISSNPPKYGVNWRCTMDVGIRVANWMIAYDLFIAFGASFDSWFHQLLASAVLSHGRHIMDNLEYSPEICSNHFLSDIVGLEFAAVHLEVTDETTAWLALALQELTHAMDEQFGCDGSNFEASTSYHRLSTELMVYGSAVGLGLATKWKSALKKYNSRLQKHRPKLLELKQQQYDLDDFQLFSNQYWLKLAKAVRFTERLQYDSKHIEQIGDNDSGRLFKLNPVYKRLSWADAARKYANLSKEKQMSEDESYYDEDILDHTHLVNIGNLLFKSGIKATDMETNIFFVLCGKKQISVSLQDNYCKKSNMQELNAWEERLKQLFLETDRQLYNFSSKSDLCKNLVLYVYADFGLYIFRSDSLYMTVRCGSVGQNGIGGHAHNDQLAITLHIDGKPLIRDPGTYLYTPLPEKRNRFRSTKAHFTIQKNSIEQNKWAEGVKGVFSLLEDSTKSICISNGIDGILLMHNGFGSPVYRLIKILSNEIVVLDFGNKICRWKEFNEFSAGYGKIERLE